MDSIYDLRMIRVFLFLFVVCLISLPSKAQKAYPDGYIVSNTGDTTWGFIRSGNFFRDQHKIRFIDIYGEGVDYTSERISAFGYEDKEYVSMKTPYPEHGEWSYRPVIQVQ